MRRIFVSTLACVVALSLCFGSNAAAQPDPDTVYLKNIQYNGSGCPPVSAVVDLAPDGQAIIVTHAEFIAELGPGIPISQSRKNCQLNLTLHVPAGFTYAIGSVDHHVDACIARGARGMLKQTFYFQGEEPQPSPWRPFTNFVGCDVDWHIRDEVETAELRWAPCGVERSLNINTQTRIDKGTSSSSASSFMTLEQQTFHLLWRTCGE